MLKRIFARDFTLLDIVYTSIWAPYIAVSWVAFVAFCISFLIYAPIALYILTHFPRLWEVR